MTNNFEVKIVADSQYGESRLTTFQLKYPRFIHAEFMTHRVFSRNASSSRAIPISKMIEQVRTNPARPVHWGINQAGMQADKEVTGDDIELAKELWIESANNAADMAEHMMSELNLHKQVVNRILEPFQHINVVVTATSYQNFFDLRSHEDAQPEIKVLSDMMLEQYTKYKAKRLGENDYHLPYIQPEEFSKYAVSDLIKFSAARCARVSYLTHDKKQPSPDKDLILYERLVGSYPIHASPTEHQARPASTHECYTSSRCGNFDQSWVQYRKFVETKDEHEFLRTKD